MARLFDDGSSEYLEIAQAIFSSPPFAVTAWINSEDVTQSQVWAYIGNSSVGNSAFRMFIIASKIYANSVEPGTSANAITTSNLTDNTWHHVCAIYVAAANRRAFLDGGSKGTNSTSVTPASLDITAIGSEAQVVPGSFFKGKIAEVALYDLSQWPGGTDGDKADNFEKILPSLAEGFSPTHFPLGLTAYWPLIRGLNDKVGGYNLSANGTTVANHPRIILPHGVQ